MDEINMEYGLIGEKLSHSFSKTLHEEFLNTKYDLVSLTKEELKIFLQKKLQAQMGPMINFNQVLRNNISF